MPVSTDATGDKIGISECDDYIEKYEACITGKVPEASGAMLKSSFEQTRKTWKDLAANPQTKSGSFVADSSLGAATTAVPADYDGDGITDFAVFIDYSGTWKIKKSTNGVIDTITPYGQAGDKPVRAIMTATAKRISPFSARQTPRGIYF